MCSILVSSLQSCNECVNGIIFPGSTFTSNYSPQTYSLDRDHAEVHALYLPTDEVRRKLFRQGLVCAEIDIPKFIPMLVASKESAAMVIMYFHGNAADISHVYRMALRQSRVFNAHFVAIEYPRYGFSEGHPSQLSINAVAHVAYDFLIEKLNVPRNRIIISGNSIGTGPACYLASYLEAKGHPAAALVLHAPYTTITNVAKDVLECLPSCFLNRWSNYPALVGEVGINNKTSGTIFSPVLFIHADNDQIIDYEQSLSMHKCRLARKLPSYMFTQRSNDDFIKGHNHFDYVIDLESPIATFLKNVSKTFDVSEFSFDESVLSAYSKVPDIYAHKTKDQSKLTAPVLCRWVMCPCVCLTESFLACSWESIQQIESYFDTHVSKPIIAEDMDRGIGPEHGSGISGAGPLNGSVRDHKKAVIFERPFKYRSKRERGKPHLTLKTVLYKLLTSGSTNIVEESPQNKAKTREDKPVLNPLTQTLKPTTTPEQRHSNPPSPGKPLNQKNSGIDSNNLDDSTLRMALVPASAPDQDTPARKSASNSRASTPIPDAIFSPVTIADLTEQTSPRSSPVPEPEGFIDADVL